MKKQFLKTFFLLFSMSIFLGTSVNNTDAFLDSDLGLNLYKDLDDGLKDFEEKMYVYELSEQDKQNISKSINKILFNKNLGSCLVDGINPNIIADIADGKIEVLLKNMKEECYNSETGEYNTKRVGNMMNEITKIREYYINKAKTKANAIHDISRIGMYSDGNTDNSPYDLIKDLDDINAIIFSDKIEYESEDVDFLKDYQDKPLIGPLGNNLAGTNGDGEENGDNNSNSNDNQDKKNSDDNNSNNNNSDNGGETYIDNTGKSTNSPDGNTYNCPVNESGLDDNSLGGLIGSINGNNNGKGDTFNYGSGGHLSLPGTNSINIPSLFSTNFESEMLVNGISPYKQITDKKVWPCNEYFCITVEFIIRNQQALDYSSDHSIENIIKTSNKHLKKSANTSLVQSKMTTNNFEMALRDLNLPDMFHMGINISSKSPPILDIKEIPGESVKNMLRKKYKDLGLNYDDPNNLNKFNQNLRKMKSVFLTTENPSNKGVKLTNQLKEVLNLRSKMLNLNKEVVSKNINNDILGDFETQFKEISQFNINIFDYINNIDVLIKKLKEIPTYTG